MATTTQEEIFSVALPSEVLAKLSAFTGLPVSLDVHDGQLFVHQRRRRITLEEMLAQCDPEAPMSDEDKEWINMRPVGRELL